MAVDINKIDDEQMLVYGQIPITKAEYLQMQEEGIDVSMVNLPGDPANEVPSTVGTPEDINISTDMEYINNTLSSLSNPSRDIQYEYGAGHLSTEYSPYSQGSTRLDEDAFLGWTAFELGYIDSSLAIQPTNIILNSLVRITPDTTVDDTIDYKKQLIKGNANVGDIILFDTPSMHNGLAGFYIGSGSFITLYTQDNNSKNDIAQFSLWEINEDGEEINTGWLDTFNGGIYRTSKLDSEGFRWYNSIENN